MKTVTVKRAIGWNLNVSSILVLVVNLDTVPHYVVFYLLLSCSFGTVKLLKKLSF